jgi:RsiW-degrading membrane proteinase PrsW (M82 family)
MHYNLDQALLKCPAEGSMHKPSLSRMGLAVLLFLGVVPAVVGYQIIREWAAWQATGAIVGVIFLLCGVTMLGSAAWVIISVGRQRLPLWTGGIASILSGGLLLAATITHVLPCSGPA